MAMRKAPAIILDEEDRLPETDTAHLLRLQQQYNHIPFAKLQLMATQGYFKKSALQHAMYHQFAQHVNTLK